MLGNGLPRLRDERSGTGRPRRGAGAGDAWAVVTWGLEGGMSPQGAAAELLLRVHSEDVYRGPSRWCQPHEEYALEGEVLGARILTRVKQWDYLIRLGIDACEIWSLVAVAVAARQGEVDRIIRSAMLACLDVLDVELQ